MLLSLLVLAGCSGPPVGERHQVGVVSLAADLPLSGDDAVDGIPVRDAFTLALTGAGSVCGAASHQDACVSIEPRIMDDVIKGIHDPAQGAKNVQALAAEPRVVGMIGPLYDSLARSEMPVANAARLPMVSPANTDPCLTQEPADGSCGGLSGRLRPRGANTYFRVVTTALSEPAAAAELAYRTLGKRRAAIIKDASTRASSLAASFSARFTRSGGKVVEQNRADLVYFAGNDLPSATALRQQMLQASSATPLIGGDALGSSQFARTAGAAARGSYYLQVGPDPGATKSAAGFVRDYRARFNREPTTTSLAAFDATGVLIDGIRRAIDAAGGAAPSRSQVLDALIGTTGYHGAMGTFGFDGHGDTTLRWVSGYQWLAPTDRAGRFTAQFAVG